MRKRLVQLFVCVLLYILVIILLQVQVSPFSSSQQLEGATVKAVENQEWKGLLKTLTWRKKHFQKHVKRSRKQSLKILLWTSKYIPRSLYYARDSALKRCNVKCEFTTDEDLVDKADALVLTSYDRSTVLPPQNKKNQIRVFLTREAPTLLHTDGQPYFYEPFPNTFNWTMTYRRDSDVVVDFGGFRLKPGAAHQAANSSNEFRDPTHLQDYREKYLSGKTKLVAWIVSNCITSSRRELYVQKLQNHISVDIYGACGTFNCSLSRKQRDSTGRVGSCYAQLSRKYKFFLSFENSLCVDYVTEKLYLALKQNMVPVVYGGADYSHFAPQHSYINALDFPSPGKLADYLRYLDIHEEEYLKYFIWKERYEIVGGSNRWCRLCQQLWSVSVTSNSSGARIIYPNYSKMYENITKWWWFQGGNPSVPACRQPPPL